MARLRVADGGDGLQTLGVAASLLNKQPRTADKGRSCSLKFGRRTKIVNRKNQTFKKTPI